MVKMYEPEMRYKSPRKYKRATYSKRAIHFSYGVKEKKKKIN